MLIAGGSTDVTTYFALRLAADGTAATGLTITGIDLQYVRSGVAPVAKVDATALAATDSTHADNKAIEIDATDQPGLYRVDWPDAAFAAGVREVILSVKVATAFTEHLRVEIDGEVNVVEWAGTDVVAGAIPAAAADAAGGLPISDAGGLDFDAMNTNINDIETDTNELQTDWVNGGRLDLLLDAIPITAMRGTDSASTHSAGDVWAVDATSQQTGGTFGQAIGDPSANTETMYDAVVTDAAGTNVAVDVVAVKAETALIVADTNELQGDWTNTGRLDTIIDSIKTTTDKFVFTVANQVDGNIIAISGDTTAANNLELMYDGTGYVDDTAPASRAQVGAIGASAGGALNFEAVEDNSAGTVDPGSTAFVGVETNNFTDTDREDGVYHIIADATNVIDVVYGFNIGGGRTASELVFKGFANANNDDLTLSAWDHPGAEWETLGTLEGAASTSNITITEALLSKHTGTGTEIGKIYIRFNGSGLSAAADLNTDQILIEAVGIGQSVGYQSGAVWIDTNSGTAGTENFVNGVADNPALTLADAITLASSLGLHRFVIAPGSSITFAEAHTDEIWEGRDWTLALGGQNITGAFIFGATVTGVGTTTAECEFEECDIGAVTLDNDLHLERCSLDGTFTVGQAGTFTLHECFTESTSAITIDFGALGTTAVHLYAFDGQINFKNMATGDTVHITGAGTISTETCTAGTIDHDGFFEYTDAGGNITENQSDIKVAVDSVLIDTTEIGTAGIGLSNIPWNASWDAEVQSECADALVAIDLDHLITTATAIPAITAGTFLDQMFDDGTAVYDRTTDSLQAIRDRGDSAWTSGGTPPTAATIADAVWDEAQADHVVADSFGVIATEIASVLIDTGEIGTAGVGLTDLGGMSTSMKAEVNAEVVDTLSTDTYVEPISAPSTTASIVTKLNWVFTLAKNKILQTENTQTIRNDADTADIATASVSDDGTTFTRGKFS